MKKFIAASILSAIAFTSNANTAEKTIVETDLLAKSIKVELQKEITAIKTVELKKTTTPKAVYIAKQHVDKQKLKTQSIGMTIVAEDE